MTPDSFPIRLEACTHRRYWEKAPGVLELRVANLDRDRPLTVRIEVAGDMVENGQWKSLPYLVAAAGQVPVKVRTVGMPPGEYLLSIRVAIELGDGTSIHLAGQVSRTVETKHAMPSNVHVSITNEIGGDGFIADTQQSPQIMAQPAPAIVSPTYEEILLHSDFYFGALCNCILKDTASSFRLHVLTGEQITIGRNAETVDITVPVPNDYVSRQHCRLRRETDGILLECLSSTNPPKLNGAEVRDSALISFTDDEDVPIVLGDQGQATFWLRSVPTTGLDEDVKQYLARQGAQCDISCSEDKELAALVIIHDRADILETDLYLWLFRAVRFSDLPHQSSLTGRVALAAVPQLVAIEMSNAGTIRFVNPIVENRHVGGYIVMPRSLENMDLHV